MGFKMKGYSYPGKTPLKSHKKGHVTTDAERKAMMDELDKKHGITRDKDGVSKEHKRIKEKAKKNDWDSGSKLSEGDYATYGQQAYDKKGNKTNFEYFEDTGKTSIDKKGRPSTKDSKGKTIYLSSANEKGQPMSLASDQFKK